MMDLRQPSVDHRLGSRHVALREYKEYHELLHACWKLERYQQIQQSMAHRGTSGDSAAVTDDATQRFLGALQQRLVKVELIMEPMAQRRALQRTYFWFCSNKINLPSTLGVTVEPPSHSSRQGSAQSSRRLRSEAGSVGGKGGVFSLRYVASQQGTADSSSDETIVTVRPMKGKKVAWGGGTSTEPVTMQPGPAPSSIAYSNARAAPSKQRPSSSTGTRSRATPARTVRERCKSAPVSTAAARLKQARAIIPKNHVPQIPNGAQVTTRGNCPFGLSVNGRSAGSSRSPRSSDRAGPASAPVTPRSSPNRRQRGSSGGRQQRPHSGQLDETSVSPPPQPGDAFGAWGVDESLQEDQSPRRYNVHFSRSQNSPSKNLRSSPSPGRYAYQPGPSGGYAYTKTFAQSPSRSRGASPRSAGGSQRPSPSKSSSYAVATPETRAETERMRHRLQSFLNAAASPAVTALFEDVNVATLSADDLKEICAAMAIPDAPVTPATSSSASPGSSLISPHLTIAEEDGGDPGGGADTVATSGDAGLAVEDIGVGLGMSAAADGGCKTGSPSSFF